MCSVTIGGPASMYFDNGLNGPIDTILFPIQHGMLCFTGFSVVTPFIVHAPARIRDEERVAQLERYRECVLGLATAPTISYPKLADYDERYVLQGKPGWRLTGGVVTLHRCKPSRMLTGITGRDR